MPFPLVNYNASFLSCSPAAGSANRIGTPGCSFWFSRKMGKCTVFSLLESVGSKLGSGSLPRFLGDIGSHRSRSVCCSKATNGILRFGGSKSHRYQGDPNPRRIRIPIRNQRSLGKNISPGKVGNLCHHQDVTSVPASSWKCQSELAPPAVVLGLSGKMENV